VSFVGFIAVVMAIPAALIRSDAGLTFAILTPPLALLAIIAIELIRAVVLLARFIGRKTGLLNHLP
jgi:hypothetical protein